MHNPSTQGIIFLIACIAILLLLLISFIVTIVYKYQHKQNIHSKEFEALQAAHQNTLLESQLEIQEQTFENISREIHDNIVQKLTVAKLHLNTLSTTDRTTTIERVTSSVHIVSQVINDLTDLSHSLSSEIVLEHGLVKAIESEVELLGRSGLYTMNVTIMGGPIFMHDKAELILYRIFQESINNIMKHAEASFIKINLHYDHELTNSFIMEIRDNGKGFSINQPGSGTGLENIKKRVAILHGDLIIKSCQNTGTIITINIPLHEKESTLQTYPGG